MNRWLIITLVAIIFLPACSTVKMNPAEHDQIGACNGVLKNQLKEGPWICFSEGKLVTMKAEFKAGQKNGRVELYDSDGKLISVSYWQDGVYQGLFTSYFPNGQMEFKIHYNQGQMIGPAEQWDQFGHPVIEKDY